jgi:hypothetical protein
LFFIIQQEGNCAFVDVRLFGSSNKQKNDQLSAAYSALLNKKLGIPTERIYLNFTGFGSGTWFIFSYFFFLILFTVFFDRGMGDSTF